MSVEEMESTCPLVSLHLGVISQSNLNNDLVTGLTDLHRVTELPLNWLDLAFTVGALQSLSWPHVNSAHGLFWPSLSSLWKHLLTSLRQWMCFSKTCPPQTLESSQGLTDAVELQPRTGETFFKVLPWTTIKSKLLTLTMELISVKAQVEATGF